MTTRTLTPTLIRTTALLLALLVATTGCAWTNRDNRPVWNAMEEHLVPEGDVAFVAALPLTIPGGIVAFVLDTFIVHPAMVVDDAAADAGDLWEDIEWAEHYYTELASVPFRAAFTPLVFVVTFLGRSAFDIPPHDDEPPRRKPIPAAPPPDAPRPDEE